MIREVVKIDEELCNGCGICIPNCHEGALQIIDGKARLISDFMCDGLGACIGHCPLGAISIEKRPAVPYDEIAVIKDMLTKGKNVVIAHLKHLRDHNENEWFSQAMNWMEDNKESLTFNLEEIKQEVHKAFAQKSSASACGCSGIEEKTIQKPEPENNLQEGFDSPSTLTHWPVQMHLINPEANYYRGKDLLLAADCVAFSMGNFHSKLLKAKSLAILCPKLDHNQNVYVDKMISLIDNAQVNTITVAMMEVPCCGGLLRFVKEAQAVAKRKVPVKAIIISISGEIIAEEWI